MQVVYKRCCGVDIHKKLIVACLWTINEKGERVKEVRSFTTMTNSLLDMLDWLKTARCEVVAVESTGVFWKPLYNLFEGVLPVLVVNAAHMKAVPGRKTDVKDAEWIGDLLQHGLLKASFIPPAPQRELRDLTRYRSSLVADRAQLINRMHKLLEDANIKLTSVATDITGVSGRNILAALAEGEEDPEVLADFARARMRRKIPELKEALVGKVKPHHRFMLEKLLGELVFYDQEIDAFNQEISQRLSLPPQPPPREEFKKGSQDNAAQTEAQGEAGQATSKTDHLKVVKELPESAVMAVEMAISEHEQVLRLLETIPGVKRRCAEIIVAEVGIDMSRFPSAGHLASWAGVCPGQNESGGKRRKAKTNKGNIWLRQTLVEAANAAMRSHNTHLGAKGRRLAARLGYKKAVLAIAHDILRIVYYMISKGEEYKDLGPDYFSNQNKEAGTRRAVRQLESYGFTVQLVAVAAG